MSGISEASLRALRGAATLVDVLPRLQLRITDRHRTLLTVTRTPEEVGDADPVGGMVVPPCGFRTAVGRAVRQHQAGGRLRFLDLADEEEPTVHLVAPPGDRLLPGGIYRAPASGDRILLLFLTDLDPEAAKEAMTGADGAGPGGHIGLHADELTRLTVVHTMAQEWDGDEAGLLMSRLLEKCVAAEAIADLRAGQPADGYSYRRRPTRDEGR